MNDLEDNSESMKIITDTEKESDESTEQVKDNNKNNELSSNKKMIHILIGGIILALISAVIVAFVIDPILEKNRANNSLNIVNEQIGPIKAMNNKIITFQGQKVENSNIEQKALSIDSKKLIPTNGFYFSNDKPNDKKKTVKVYIDFSSQKSRDFILLNNVSLRNMVESGLIDLYVIPVPTGNAFSVYASEAIAESFYTTPDKSWNFMVNLLKASVDFSSDKNDDYLELVADTAKNNDIINVDKESIDKGTFASWIISVGDDEKLQTGFYPPLVYINDKLIDPTDTPINDPRVFRKEVMKNE